ncbi:MAG: hypothetical protein V4529_04645 [Gemmatimonadota bacterium]
MRISRLRRGGICLAAALSMGGCSDFVTVQNPNIVEAGGINPDVDGALIAYSAFQDFVAGFGDIALYTAWFTTEAWTGDSSEDRSEVGRRAIDPANPRLNTDVWIRFSRGLATTENTRDILLTASDATKNIHHARVNLAAGYSYLLMAETFCRGTARGGPVLTTAEMLNLATERLTSARDIGLAAGGAPGTLIVNAASVGLGRALLQAGKAAEAAAAVRNVPANFEYLLYTQDDPANRARLGNRMWEATVDRPSLVVPPVYRAAADAGDPRIRYQNTGLRAYDGFLPMYAQRKYPSWAASYRLATGLEARYIAVEAAGDQGAMLNFVNERRAAGNLAAVSGLTGDALLTEFLAQKSLDFWLEGRRMGDFRRHGALVPNVAQPGEVFYKPAAGPVGNGMCFPVPLAETSANSNFR